MRRGGDWRHPGVYSLVHAPTGLEYVGASSCVSKRIGQHFNSISKYANGESIQESWPIKLHLALLFLDFGPVSTVATLKDIQAMTPFDCFAAITSATKQGMTVQVSTDDICPVWIRTCSLNREEIKAAERETYNRRRPLLNGPKYIGYGGANESSYNSQTLTSLQLNPPPDPISYAWVKALPIITKLLSTECQQRIDAQVLDETRRLLARQINEKALQAAEHAFNAEVRDLTDESCECIEYFLNMGMALNSRIFRT